MSIAQAANTNSSPSLETWMPPLVVQQRIAEHTADVALDNDVAMEAYNLPEDSTASDLVQVLTHAPKLAADLIAIANCPLYSGREQILSLERAIVRLGLKRAKNFVLAATVSSMMRLSSLQEAWITEVLTRHCFLTGRVSAQLNQFLDCGFVGEELVGGLIHDIGRLLLASAYPDEFTQFDPLDFVEANECLELEQSILSTTHACVGAWYGSQRGLPEFLLSVVMHHHDPKAATQHQKLVALVAAADHLANHYQRLESTEHYDPAKNQGICLLEQLGVEDAVSRFAADYAAVLDEALAVESW